MSKVVWKGGALIAPLPPVLVTCSEKTVGEDGTECVKDNIITVAWTGITCTNPPKTYVSVRPGRFSHHILSQTREFVINLATSDMAKLVDYCGIYTGAKVDKFEKCGFTKEKSESVSCPSIAQCPMSIECRVYDVIEQGSHDMFLADILAVRVDEKLLDEKGKLELAAAGLLAFAHGEYFRLGEKVGDFGFSARREHKKGSGKGFEKFAEKSKESKSKKFKDILDSDDFDADELWGDDVEVVEIIVPEGKKVKKHDDKKSHASKHTDKYHKYDKTSDHRKNSHGEKSEGRYGKDKYSPKKYGSDKSRDEKHERSKKQKDYKSPKSESRYSKSESKVTKKQNQKHK